MNNRILSAFVSVSWLALVALVGSAPQTLAAVLDQEYLLNNLIKGDTSPRMLNLNGQHGRGVINGYCPDLSQGPTLGPARQSLGPGYDGRARIASVVLLLP
jgi:hypothetical protein